MLNLPRGTHRRLIEPLSKVQHIKFVLVKRFLSFIQQIRHSNKNSSKILLESIFIDTNSVTGSNLCNILLMTEKAGIQQLEPTDVTSMRSLENILGGRNCRNEKWKPTKNQL